MPASNTRGSNTAQTNVEDRDVSGPQPDPSTPTGTTPNNSVTNAQLAAAPANTVKANPTAASAAPQDVAAAASRMFARLATGNLVWATVAQISALLGWAWTNAQQATMADGRIKGNGSGGVATPSDLTGAQAAAVLAGGAVVTGTTTAALAKLTPGGTNGSLAITFANGLATNVTYVAPT